MPWIQEYMIDMPKNSWKENEENSEVLLPVNHHFVIMLLSTLLPVLPCYLIQTSAIFSFNKPQYLNWNINSWLKLHEMSRVQKHCSQHQILLSEYKTWERITVIISYILLNKSYQQEISTSVTMTDNNDTMEDLMIFATEFSEK